MDDYALYSYIEECSTCVICFNQFSAYMSSMACDADCGYHENLEEDRFFCKTIICMSCIGKRGNSIGWLCSYQCGLKYLKYNNDVIVNEESISYVQQDEALRVIMAKNLEHWFPNVIAKIISDY